MAQDIAGSTDPHLDTRSGPAVGRPGGRFRMAIAFASLVVWMLLTTSNPFNVHASSGLVGALAEGPQWGIALAALFLIALTGLARWGDLGLNPPASARSLLLPNFLYALFLLRPRRRSAA